MSDPADAKPQVTDLVSTRRVVETPTDTFRRQLTVGILFAAGLIFMTLVGGGTWVLIRGQDDKPLEVAQSILTTSIGVVAGVVGTIVGFFFQSRER